MNFSMKNLMALFCLTGLVLLGLETSAQAASATYALSLDGSQETGAGDLDGAGSGTITLDDVTGSVSWNITYADIAAPTGMHIHTGVAGISDDVLFSLGIDTSGGAGTLIHSLTAPLSSISSVLSSPLGFYVNIHNADFGPGAIRGQLGTLVPEPTSVALIALGLIGMMSHRSRSAVR